MRQSQSRLLGCMVISVLFAITVYDMHSRIRIRLMLRSRRQIRRRRPRAGPSRRLSLCRIGILKRSRMTAESSDGLRLVDLVILGQKTDILILRLDLRG